MRTIEQWADLAGGAVRLRDPDDAWHIAVLCFDAEREGRNAAVWHNAAIFYNSPVCHCAVCDPPPPRQTVQEHGPELTPRQKKVLGAAFMRASIARSRRSRR